MLPDQVVLALFGMVASFVGGVASSIVAARLVGASPTNQRLVAVGLVTGAIGFGLGLAASPAVGRLTCAGDCHPGPSPSLSVIVNQPSIGLPQGVSDPCKSEPFLGKTIIDRNKTGRYSVELERCELLWFNSGSVLLGDRRLGGGVASQNTVLLYRATSKTRLQVAVGDQEDAGHEWLATTTAGTEETVEVLAAQALGGENCGGGCDTLLLIEYVGEALAAKNVAIAAGTSGPCVATDIGPLTTLTSRLWQWNGGFLNVEFYSDGLPEHETILPFDEAVHGYRVLSPQAGHLWSYPSTCQIGVVQDSVIVHADQRVSLGYRNEGYLPWQDAGIFGRIGGG